MRSGSLRSGLLVLTTTAMGAGVLTLPFAMREFGWALGSAVVVALAYLNVVSLELLLDAGMRLGANSYSDLIRVVGGPFAAGVLDSTVTIITWGAIIAYFVFIKQLLPPLLTTFGVPASVARAEIVLPVVAMMAFAIALPRDITSIGKFSMLGICSVLYLAALLVRCAHQDGAVLFELPAFLTVELGAEGKVSPLSDYVARLANASALIISGYLCQYNVFFVYSDVKEPTMRRLRKITRLSTLFQALCYLMLGLCGYATFGPATSDNIYTNFAPGDAWANFGRLLVCTSLCISIPLCIFAARSNLVSLLSKLLHAVRVDNQQDRATYVYGSLTRSVDSFNKLYALSMETTTSAGVHVDNPIFRVSSSQRVVRVCSDPEPPRGWADPQICQVPAYCPQGGVDLAALLLPTECGSPPLTPIAQAIEEEKHKVQSELDAAGWVLHIVATAAIIATTMVLAFVVPSVSYLLGKLGGVCGATQMYIMPGLVLVKCEDLLPPVQRALTLVGFGVASIVCLAAVLL
eukprot:CAMPEP_0183478784 /NCGR_PEP_ID=MMETSP0370-20130417/170522_1 /TAXON_ID=268820 /ORGANISM="Peridinium aciculiferum, Strain PAER-2" /LENGTH=518 /DNA_ID=CAMNT_0025671755 /DNA_START=18 /DNA_END=1574 /DNA_ORIENTATION=-